jgi:hypothetical protein
MLLLPSREFFIFQGLRAVQEGGAWWLARTRRTGSNGTDEKDEKEGSGWVRLTSAQESREKF